MTGFYRNMATGDYDEFRDTDDVQHRTYVHRVKPTQKPGKVIRSKQSIEDLRPLGDDDYEY